LDPFENHVHCGVEEDEAEEVPKAMVSRDAPTTLPTWKPRKTPAIAGTMKIIPTRNPIAEKSNGMNVPNSTIAGHLRGLTIGDRVWVGIGAVPRVDRIHTER